MHQMGMGEFWTRSIPTRIFYPDNFVRSGPKNLDQTEAYWTDLCKQSEARNIGDLLSSCLAREELKACARDYGAAPT